jgi:hypothetical protein
VHVTKDVLRWRTALISRELEAEILDAIDFDQQQRELATLMDEKVVLERAQARLRLDRLHRKLANEDSSRIDELSSTLAGMGQRLVALDDQISPLAQGASELGNPLWGPVMRAGNDKSLFARQVERYADVYTSRASNLRYETPFGYLRAARGSLPHDDPHGDRA